MNIGNKCEICGKDFTPKVPQQKKCGSKKCEQQWMRLYQRERIPEVNPITGWRDDSLYLTPLMIEPIRL